MDNQASSYAALVDTVRSLIDDVASGSTYTEQDQEYQHVRELLVLAIGGGAAMPPLRGGVVVSLAHPDAPPGCLVPHCSIQGCQGNRVRVEGVDEEGNATFMFQCSHYKNARTTQPAAGTRTLTAAALGPRIQALLQRYLSVKTDPSHTLLTDRRGQQLSAGGRGGGAWSAVVRACSTTLSSGACCFSSADSRFLFVRYAEDKIKDKPLHEQISTRMYLADCMLSSLTAWERVYARSVGRLITTNAGAQAVFGEGVDDSDSD